MLREYSDLLLDCRNQFVKVEYIPETTTISCIFQNTSDLSPKSCSVKYGTCDQEMYTIQGNTTDQSPFTVMLELNSNPMNCYVVTASNDTLTLMVNGRFETHRSTGTSANAGTITGSVIGVLLVLIVLVIASVLTSILVVKYRRKLSGKVTLHSHYCC